MQKSNEIIYAMENKVRGHVLQVKGTERLSSSCSHFAKFVSEFGNDHFKKKRSQGNILFIYKIKS